MDVQVLAGLSILFVLSPVLTAIMLAVVPAIAIGAVIFGTYVRGISKSYQKALAAGFSRGREFCNIRTVRSFANEEKEISRYAEKINKSYDSVSGVRRLRQLRVWCGSTGLPGNCHGALVRRSLGSSWTHERWKPTVVFAVHNLHSIRARGFVVSVRTLMSCRGRLRTNVRTAGSEPRHKFTPRCDGQAFV